MEYLKRTRLKGKRTRTAQEWQVVMDDDGESAEQDASRVGIIYSSRCVAADGTGACAREDVCSTTT